GSLLGAIIERVTGRLYRRYMTEEILNPLKMNRSTFSIEEVQKMCNVSVLYVYDKAKKQHEKQDWPGLGNYEVGGGIRSSVRDLLKYGELFLSEGKLGENQFISGKSLKKMYHPHIKVDPDTSYGFGFKVTENYHEATLVEHSGGQPGVASNFGFLPEENICVAVLTNVSGATAGDIWLEAVNTVLDLPIETKRSILPEKEMESEQNIDRFIGKFSSKEGQEVTIAERDSSLTAELEGEIHSLKIADEDLLIIEETEKPIRFFFNKKREAWAIFIGMRMLLRENEKQ